MSENRVGGGTATATSGAATLNNRFGTVTSESLTTAAAGVYTLTVTNAAMKGNEIVAANVYNGSSTTGTPQVVSATPSAGSLVILVKNIHASAAFNGTLAVSFAAFAP